LQTTLIFRTVDSPGINFLENLTSQKIEVQKSETKQGQSWLMLLTLRSMRYGSPSALPKCQYLTFFSIDGVFNF
jgi:hypothetical protein